MSTHPHLIIQILFVFNYKIFHTYIVILEGDKEIVREEEAEKEEREKKYLLKTHNFVNLLEELVKQTPNFALPWTLETTYTKKNSAALLLEEAIFTYSLYLPLFLLQALPWLVQ